MQGQPFVVVQSQYQLGFLAALEKACLATLGSPSHVAVVCWNWAEAAHVPHTPSRFTRHPACVAPWHRE